MAESSIERRRAGPAQSYRWLSETVKETYFTAGPQCVAELYAHEWKRESGGEDAIGFVKEINSIRALREKNMSQKRVCGPAVSVYELWIFARRVSLSHPKQRPVSTSTRLQTSQTSPTMPWNLWARSSDNVLSSWPLQLSHFCNCWSCWAGKMEGAELSPSCTQHTVSPCAWYQHTSVSGTLRSRTIQRSEHMSRGRHGIELAHSEGQYVIDFLWDMRKFYDSIKAHLLIPQLVARGYPLEILVLGSLTHKSPRCLQVGSGYSDIINGCASSILPELLVGQRPSF